MTQSYSTPELWYQALEQSKQHLNRLHYAKKSLSPILPLTGALIASQDPVIIQALDQFIYRFTKLQDTIGQRLLPLTLELLGENYQDRPMLDKLNRLEKLQLLSSALRWAEIRALRNTLAHDYPNRSEEQAATIQLALDAAPWLEDLLDKLEEKLAHYLPTKTNTLQV